MVGAIADDGMAEGEAAGPILIEVSKLSVIGGVVITAPVVDTAVIQVGGSAVLDQDPIQPPAAGEVTSAVPVGVPAGGIVPVVGEINRGRLRTGGV